MTWIEAKDAIRSVLHLVSVPEGWMRPEGVVAEYRDYRGKRRYVVGYWHSRLGAHHMSGRTYERILGYGDTPEDAIAMMRRKLGVEL